MPKIKKELNNDNFTTGVAFGHCKTWIEFYAQGIGVSSSELADRVGALLHTTQVREIHGIEHNLPSLRRQSTKRNKTPRSLAMARGTHSKTPIGIRGYDKGTYYKLKTGKPHWTQLPKNKARVSALAKARYAKRMNKMSEERKAA